MELARRIVAGLVGGAGVLIMLSAATPALMPRLALLERFSPAWGVIAYRQADGSIGLRVSAGHSQAFHPVNERPTPAL